MPTSAEADTERAYAEAVAAVAADAFARFVRANPLLPPDDPAMGRALLAYVVDAFADALD